MSWSHATFGTVGKDVIGEALEFEAVVNVEYLEDEATGPIALSIL